MKKILIVISIIMVFFILSCTYFEMMKKLKSGIPVYGKDISVIPIDLRGHKIYVKVKINDGQKEYNFILDTGALTMLDEQTAKELDLEKGAKIPVGEDAHLVNTKMLLGLGDMKVKDFIIPMIDLPEASGSDPNIDGFIGSDFLRFFRLTIDYKQERIILSRNNDSLDFPEGAYKIRIKKHTPLQFPLAKCKIDGNIEADGMIDTGSPFAIVFPLTLIEKQNFSNESHLIKSTGIMAKWPFTSSDDNYLARIKSFKMGTLEIKNLPVIYAELPGNISYPLLGKEFLSQFLITINYPDDEMILVPNEETEFKTNLFSTGLELIKDKNDKTVVRGFWNGSPSDKGGIQLNDEVLEINSEIAKDLSLREINYILNNDKIENIKLLIKNSEGEGIVILRKELLFPEIDD